ncbi:MAG: hypothetical protein IPP49_17055 [Saprospiraceae bacterium]|nr:hypothetical protein [Saprospiraceae bacterium]
MSLVNEAFEYEAFYIYEHEKIGFVDSQEYKALRKDVKLFIKDMTNPKGTLSGDWPEEKTCRL